MDFFSGHSGGKGFLYGAIAGAGVGGANLLTLTQAAIQTAGVSSDQINGQFAEKQVQEKAGTNTPQQKETIDVLDPFDSKRKRGTMTVDNYSEVTDGGNRGVDIELLYKDNKSGLSDFQWIQNVTTNHPKPGTPSTQHVDRWEGKNFPFYWEEDENEFENKILRATDARFSDAPRRPYFDEKNIRFFSAELTLVGKKMEDDM